MRKTAAERLSEITEMDRGLWAQGTVFAPQFFQFVGFFHGDSFRKKGIGGSLLSPFRCDLCTMRRIYLVG